MPAAFAPRALTILSRLYIQPGNSIWQAENYRVAELEQVTVEGEEWVRWQFSKATDAFLPSLAYRIHSSMDPRGFSVHVWNRGSETISFSSWGETDAQRWQHVPPGEKKTVELEGIPTLVAQATEQNVLYDVLLRDLVIDYPEAEGVFVRELEAPREMAAEETVEIDLVIDGHVGDRIAALEVRVDHWVVWRIELSARERQQLDEAQRLSLEREVPWYLSPNEVAIGFVLDQLRAPGTEGRTQVVNALQPGLPKVERRIHNGRPTFFINDEPIIWQGYATYHNISPAVFSLFAEHGANLFHVVGAPGRHVHNITAPTWLGGDEYDFGEVEQWVSTVLRANPDAKLIFRLALNLPPFWFDDHADSRVRVRTMDGREMVWDQHGGRVASLTCETWREKQAEQLRKLIRYCASRPWASQVIGFNIGGGITEEWFSFASNSNIVTPIEFLSDYSPVNQQAFREWCAEQGLPYAEIPHPEHRIHAGHDLFPDSYEGRWAAAYNRFLNETTAETLMHFAATVKDETDRRSLVSAYYGYVVLLTGEARQSTSGHFGLRPILESEDIDYLSGVPLFAFRHLTEVGYAGQPTAVESLLAHGKQYVDDNDIFTWLHHDHWYTEYDPDDPRGAAIEMHRRWLASEAVRGNSRVWFSLTPKWHNDAPLMAEYERQTRILKDTLAMDRSPAEEIAFVVDDHTFSWLTPDAQTHYPVQLLLGALGRTGAPLGVWLLSDIDRLPDRIRFVAVVNSAAARDEDLEKLRAQIEAGGRTFLIVGTPGLIDATTGEWDHSGPAELLEMSVRVETEKHSGRAMLEGGEVLCPMNVVMQGHSRNPEKIQPRAWLDDDGFLFYEDKTVAGGERSLANDGRLIWCGVPPYASEEWLRDLLIQAGVHCYAPAPCSVHASGDLVAITSVFDDERDIELQWPEAVSIEDLFSGWQGQGERITCPFNRGQTRLFRVSTP